MLSILKRLIKGGNSDGTSDEDVRVEGDKTSETPYIVSSVFYILVILFVGIPMWFYTCSATRYSLPDLTSLNDKLIKGANSPPKLHLDISVVQLSSYDAKNYDDDTIHFSDQQTNYLRTNLPKQLNTSIRNLTYNIDWRVRRPTHDENKIFLAHQHGFTSSNDSLHVALRNLEGKLLAIHKPSNRFRLFIYLIEEPNYLAYCDHSRTHTYTIGFERFVYLCPSNALSVAGDYTSTVNLINDVLNEIYTNTVDLEKVKHILNMQVDLLFSLLPDKSDPTNYHILSDVADKIHHIYDKNVKELFPELKDLINMRLVTQNVVDVLDDKLFAKITKKPEVAKKVDPNATTSETIEPTILQVNKLDLLFHEFESRASKHSSQNVVNILSIIATEKAPIVFEQKKTTEEAQHSFLEGQDSNSMLIFNDDKSLVLGLRAIIRRVVGLTSVNLCKNCLVRRDIFFNRWEIDAIMGALAIEKLQNTLLSLQSISQHVVGIKIPKDVSSMANEAYELASKSLELLETKQTLESYRSASRAFEISEEAFYDPSLLESLYFPDDLKYAIYLPLFLPLAFPFGMSVLNLIKHITRLCSRSVKQKIN